MKVTIYVHEVASLQRYSGGEWNVGAVVQVKSVRL